MTGWNGFLRGPRSRKTRTLENVMKNYLVVPNVDLSVLEAQRLELQKLLGVADRSDVTHEKKIKTLMSSLNTLRGLENLLDNWSDRRNPPEGVTFPPDPLLDILSEVQNLDSGEPRTLPLLILGLTRSLGECAKSVDYFLFANQAKEGLIADAIDLAARSFLLVEDLQHADYEL